MTRRAAASAVTIAVLWFGFALPGLADRYGGMAQDLLYRPPGPPGESLLQVLNVFFAVVLAVLLVSFVWAWRRGDRNRLVTFGVAFAAVGGLWWFGLGYLEAAFVEGLAPTPWGRWQG